MANHRPPTSDLRPPNSPELEPTVEIEQAGTRLLGDKRRILSVLAAFLLLIVGIYVLLPKVVGVGGSLKRLSDPSWPWIVVAIGFNAFSFFAYAALFRGILAGTDEDETFYRRIDYKTSLNITMAGLAASTLFSAAGAGGIALTYWALRKAGMERRRSACRMVAFLVLLYTVYAVALIVFGVLLRTGVFNGEAPLGGTIVPAGLAAAAFLVMGLVALIPTDLERRIAKYQSKRWVRRVASGPATVATGVRTALDYLGHPRRGANAIAGAVGYWVGMVGILWACFHAYGGGVPFGVVVMGFFVGMVANLAPSPAAGVGTLDAGLIGAFLLFDIPVDTVFPAVLTFRLVGFWLPIIPGLACYLGLRRQVNRWQEEDESIPYTSESKVTAEAK
ncbi:MAG TPA: lysylphosphatidylglycerol synthase transmembrane domain-containing protein [Thermoleophilaceae bacterium]|nr:lysylphosphatidylglycerol synthase transmembrane domain-containing protein [Thermoleophilaceae bacterium]